MGKPSVRVVRRDQGRCMDCGAPAMTDITWTQPRARWMATGKPDQGRHVLEAAIERALGRPWTYGDDPLPTFERLTHTGFCVECDQRNRERRRRRREGRELLPGCRIVRDPAWTVPTYRDVVARVALALRNARRATGLSQAAVARRLGRRQSFLSKLEAGQRRLTLVDLVEIAAVIDLDVGEFASVVGSVWREEVYRHVQPVFEVKSAPDGDGAPTDEPAAPTAHGEVVEPPDQPRLWATSSEPDGE